MQKADIFAHAYVRSCGLWTCVAHDKNLRDDARERAKMHEDSATEDSAGV